MKPPDADQIFWAMWMRRAFDGSDDTAQGFTETAALNVERAAQVHHEALLDGRVSDVDAGRWHSDPGHHD